MADDKNNFNIDLLPTNIVNALLLPGSKQIGDAAGDILEALFNVSLHNLRKFNIVKKKDLEDYRDKINNKGNNIPEEYRDSSKFGLVLKALEDSQYQIDKEDMRDYFSNLIANSMDVRKNDKISYKFSSILANMTSDEALLLKRINTLGGAVPAGNVYRYKYDGQGANRNSTIFLIFPDLLENTVSLEISLLESSNLIERVDKKLAGDFRQSYKMFDEYISHEYPERYPEYEFHTEKYSYVLTHLGHSFCEYVL